VGLLVRFGRHRAFLREAEWRCADPAFEQSLNQEMDAWMQATGGPSVSDPHPDQTAAKEMARRLGGRVLLNVKSSRSRASEVYFDRRQMELAFPSKVLKLK
jgi:hypothetical protein